MDEWQVEALALEGGVLAVLRIRPTDGAVDMQLYERNAAGIWGARGRGMATLASSQYVRYGIELDGPRLAVTGIDDVDIYLLDSTGVLRLEHRIEGAEEVRAFEAGQLTVGGVRSSATAAAPALGGLLCVDRRTAPLAGPPAVADASGRITLPLQASLDFSAQGFDAADHLQAVVLGPSTELTNALA